MATLVSQFARRTFPESEGFLSSLCTVLAPIRHWEVVPDRHCPAQVLVEAICDSVGAAGQARCHGPMAKRVRDWACLPRATAVENWEEIIVTKSGGTRT